MNLHSFCPHTVNFIAWFYLKFKMSMYFFSYGAASHVDEAGQCAEEPVFAVHRVPDGVQVALFISTCRFRRWRWVAVHHGRVWSCRWRGSVGFRFLCAVNPSIWKQQGVNDSKTCGLCLQVDLGRRGLNQRQSAKEKEEMWLFLDRQWTHSTRHKKLHNIEMNMHLWPLINYKSFYVFLLLRLNLEFL